MTSTQYQCNINDTWRDVIDEQIVDFDHTDNIYKSINSNETVNEEDTISENGHYIDGVKSIGTFQWNEDDDFEFFKGVTWKDYVNHPFSKSSFNIAGNYIQISGGYNVINSNNSQEVTINDRLINNGRYSYNEYQ